jgi:hypothetical protein
MRRIFLTTIATITIGLAAATAAHSADVPQLAEGGEMTVHTMTDAEAGRYMQEMGIAPRPHCRTATNHRWLYTPGGHHVADLYNHTSWCWGNGHLIKGSVRVLPSQTHDATFSVENRLYTVGYPVGYYTLRRNTCVKATFKWELTQFNTWDLSAPLQVRSNGDAAQIAKCYSNMGTHSW